MIKFTLKCVKEHNFEAWFPSNEAYEKQIFMGLVACPICQTVEVQKAIMAPNIKKPSPKMPQNIANPEIENLPENLQKLITGYREKIAKEYDYVGDKFADEARAIHYGESEERAIFGEATPKQANELIEEGIEVAPILPILNPKKDKDLN
jgi:hypothetical protein